MTSIDTLAITIPTLLAIFGAIIAWENFKLKKKESTQKDEQHNVEKIKEEDNHRREVELKLVAIEKDVQYIRLAVDKFEARGEDHEKRIQTLEKTCKKIKGEK